MKKNLAHKAPWLISLVLLALVSFQIAMADQLKHNSNSGYIVIPIRLPLTRPEPSEALLISRDPPQFDASKKGFDRGKTPKGNYDTGERKKLRMEISMSCRNIGAVLDMPQLLYIMSHRDRLERDFYEGHLYQILENKLKASAEK